jgi:RNA 2',3'-cyclic 3'-phosphodiesterase
MRTFIAFDVPLEPLQHVQETLDLQGVTLHRQMHCTLKFLGELTDDEIQTVRSALQTISFDPLTLHYSSLGVFDSRERIRVIWAGLEPQQPIKRLHKDIESVLISVQPQRNFTPHVTLARVKAVHNRQSLLEKIDQPLSSEPFTVNQFKLYQSEFAEGQGHIHKSLENYNAT